jgi:hypothetical protein
MIRRSKSKIQRRKTKRISLHGPHGCSLKGASFSLNSYFDQKKSKKAKLL